MSCRRPIEDAAYGDGDYVKNVAHKNQSELVVARSSDTDSAILYYSNSSTCSTHTWLFEMTVVSQDCYE